MQRLWTWPVLTTVAAVVLAAVAVGSASVVSNAYRSAAFALAGGCDANGLLADFGPTKLTTGGEETAVVPIEIDCAGTYELVMVSGDREHTAGYQPEQTDERWLLEFVDASGDVVATSESTDDLPEADTIGITTGSIDLDEAVVGVRARHAGPTGPFNSVEAVSAAVLVRSSEAIDCDDRLSTVYFDGPPLTVGQSESATLDAPHDCVCGEQHVVAVSQDLRHEPGYQTTQTEEQWRIDATDTDGGLLGATDSTGDLTEDKWVRVDLLSLVADPGDTGMTLTAVNTGGLWPNSIDPVAVVVAAK